MGRLSKSGAALGAAVLMILGGGAYALGSSSAGTMTVCVSHKGGALYKAKRCAKHDQKLRLNEQGARGPSNAFSGSIEGPVTITIAGTPGNKVGHLNLQPGSYVIFAKAWIENQSMTSATTAGCELDAGADSDSDTVKLEPSGNNAFRGAVALTVAHTFRSAGPAQLSCSTGMGATVTANNVVVTAIQVGALVRNALIAR
jgi:hypothetical protein